MLLFSVFAPKIIKTFLHFPGEVTAQVPKTEVYCEVKPPLPSVPGPGGRFSPGRQAGQQHRAGTRASCAQRGPRAHQTCAETGRTQGPRAVDEMH